MGRDVMPPLPPIDELKRRLADLETRGAVQLAAVAGAYSYDTPCPFLVEGTCSIYEHRPFACRKNHNMDVDALFCRLDVPAGFEHGVLRITQDAALLVWSTTITPSMGIADIRDWFPGPRELRQGPIGRIPTADQALQET